MRKRKNRIYSKQVLHLTSTPPLSKITSAGILSIWQKETTSSHIWTAIKFEYFDHTKISFFEIPWFFPDFQQNFKFPDFSLQGIFFSPFSLFSLFSRVRGHPVESAEGKECCRPSRDWTHELLMTSRMCIQLSHQGQHAGDIEIVTESNLFFWYLEI